MEYRRLGRTGLKVSELCLGSMQFGWTADEALSFEILSAAWQAGINFIDSADIYSTWAPGNPGGISEQIIGKWMSRSNIQRDQIVIATKVRGQMGQGPNDEGLSRSHIFDAVEKSLKRLNTDYIDLYQAHWFDEETPIDETLTAFDDIVRQGKVRYIGASNYPAWRLMGSLWVSERLNIVRYDSLQPHYNLVNRAEFEQEMSELCLVYGIGVIPYSPLAGGFLTGKYQKDEPVPESQRSAGTKHRYFNDRGWKVLNAVEEIAAEQEKSVSQIALAWLLSQEGITSPIIGPRTLEQLKDNLGDSDFRLNKEEMHKLNIASDWKNR